jgi:hypothetical protein
MERIGSKYAVYDGSGGSAAHLDDIFKLFFLAAVHTLEPNAASLDFFVLKY